MIKGDRLTIALHAWTEVFMRSTVRDMMQFSRQSGMSMPQFNTLLYLNHQGRCDVSGIGDHFGVTSAAASQMIDRLVQQGYLERSEDPEDRRSRQITVTEKGRELIGGGIAARRRLMDEIASALSPEEKDMIIEALNLLTQAARRLEPITSVPEEEQL